MEWANMETVISALLATIPNLAIAIWVISAYQKTIGELLVNQKNLIDQLMALHPPADTKKDIEG